MSKNGKNYTINTKINKQKNNGTNRSNSKTFLKKSHKKTIITWIITLEEFRVQANVPRDEVMRLQEVLFTLFRLQNKTDPITQKFFDRVSMGFGGFWWVWMGFDGFRWGFDGSGWGWMGLDGFRWISMGFSGFGWISVGFGGFGWVWMDFGGFGWVWMGLDGFGWVWMDFDGFQWVWMGFVSKNKKLSLGAYHFWDVHVFHQTSHHAANEMRKSRHCLHRINESKDFWWRKKGENFWRMITGLSFSRCRSSFRWYSCRRRTEECRLWHRL